jgi:hypothetical protein
MGNAIARRLGLGPDQSVSLDKASELWDPFVARVLLASNCRARAHRAVNELGWAPQHTSIIDWILNELPTTPAT